MSLAEWANLGYQLGPKLKGKDFDFQFHVAPKASAKNVRARAAFNILDQSNHYFVEFSHNRVWIGRAEGGIEQLIGTAAQTGLQPGRAYQLAIKRREDRIAAVLDRQLVALAYDDTFSAGRVALGVPKGSMAVSKVKVQSVGSLYFADDFMRTSTTASDWEPVSGHWEIHALENPTRSINAFSYIGRANKSPALATTGQWFWGDYEFLVSFKSVGGGCMGVHFCYADASDHFRLIWGANDGDVAARQLQVVRVVDGRPQVLAKAAGGFRPHQWYRLRIVAVAPHLEVAIDGREVFRLKDSRLTGGKIGLYSDAKGPTYFDDVLVRRARGFFDDFSQHAAETWLPLGGQWQAADSGIPGLSAKGDPVLTVNATPDSRIVAGQGTWERYRFSADASAVAKGSLGLIFAYKDEASYGLFRVSTSPSPAAEILHVLNGKAKVLSTRGLAQAALTKPHRLSVDVEDGVARAFVDAVEAGAAWHSAFAYGKIGLFASETAAAFDNVDVRFRTRELKPVFTAHRMFSEETTMANWAAAQGDWHEVKETAVDKEREVRWHRGSFPGDLMVRVNMPAASQAKGTLSLCLSAAEEKMASGYELAAAADGEWRLELRRKGVVQAKKTLARSTAFKHLQFRRLGAHVMVYLDRQPVLVWQDTQPLDGDRLGWHAQDMLVENEQVEVFSDSVLTDSFTTAPVTWRVGAGTWEVTNRWQCDPRWSFFSGWRDDGPAAIWHKREFNGDLTLEFCAAIKMDYTKSVGYAFASDLNATICADGAHTDSGYTFVFGGWGNTKTAIVRKSQTVAEVPKPIISGNIHRRWWYFKIEKRGSKLNYWVDNKLILEFDDPKPLTGNRVAIWTYRHGMVLSRFRVSCAGPMTTERFSFAAPADSRCFYDSKSAAAAKK